MTLLPRRAPRRDTVLDARRRGETRSSKRAPRTERRPAGARIRAIRVLTGADFVLGLKLQYHGSDEWHGTFGLVDRPNEGVEPVLADGEGVVSRKLTCANEQKWARSLASRASTGGVVDTEDARLRISGELVSRHPRPSVTLGDGTPLLGVREEVDVEINAMPCLVHRVSFLF